ncbi:MAG: MgtC/SapB family protein [Verrucomicrobia bacterium]|nr:MgtC/SapB family protein [Verrucomicrobiota bacterium]
MSTQLGLIVVSACLGALIGLIRQWSEQRDKPGEMNFGGVRTYTLWSLLGCLASYLTEHYSTATLPIALFLIGGHLTMMHWRDGRDGHPGSTTFVAALLTCLVGALVNWGHQQMAVLVAALTMVTLGSKQPLHSWTRHFTTEDIRSALQFAAISGVILPLVPDSALGPYGAFNPYSTWLMVVLISGLGFVGYLLMRLLGAQAGITVTGLVGGLASSTATTLTFSRRSKDEPELSSSYAFAVVLACTVMLARVGVMLAAINADLARVVALPFVAMALPGVGFAIWQWRTHRAQSSTETTVEPPKIRNPLGLGMAIKFGLLYALVAFLVKAATAMQFTASLLPLSFFSGLTDMDAIALLMANSLHDGTVATELAAKCVIVGAIANSIMKGGFAISLGSPQLRRKVSIVLGLTVAAGVASMIFLV